jgi:hypothetical protein
VDAGCAHAHKHNFMRRSPTVPFDHSQDLDHLECLLTDTTHRALINVRRRRHMEVARLRATQGELNRMVCTLTPDEATDTAVPLAADSTEALMERLHSSAAAQVRRCLCGYYFHSSVSAGTGGLCGRWDLADI